MPHYLDKEPEPINNYLAPGDIDEDDPKMQAAMRKGLQNIESSRGSKDVSGIIPK